MNLKKIVTDEMIERIEKGTNIYAMIKTGKELKSTRDFRTTVLENGSYEGTLYKGALGRED